MVVGDVGCSKPRCDKPKVKHAAHSLTVLGPSLLGRVFPSSRGLESLEVIADWAARVGWWLAPVKSKAKPLR
jgi:hypothetical protein